MLCIMGVIVFSQFAMLTWLVSGFVTLETKSVRAYMPAVGWTVGFIVGVIRIPSLLRRSENQSHKVDDSNCVYEEEPTSPSKIDTDASPTISQSSGFSSKVMQGVKSGGIGAFVGFVCGMFLSLFLIIICTAAILSPVAPSHWRTGLRSSPRQEMMEPAAVRARNRNEGVSTGNNYWHPAFGFILKWTIPPCVIAMGIFFVLADETSKPVATRS
ncbi:hypothetical protein FF011L_25960 [Roseimaritima multifibrata]|uniref:Uncharacterized protein n=2 Tax=Roseimaritima multifibrata TaxID=1930274 RepID=A0A517MG09_9BACT|nr:hypothetical protein FF011L_25960 [Roseimaritima multifibrata]